jgi:hypothetical protein
MKSLMNDTAMTHGIILEPNYAVLRSRFAAEAKLQADIILSDLLPEGLIEPEHIKTVQLAVLRAMQSVLVPINICIQAADCNAAVLDCRELLDSVSKTIIAKADGIERAISYGASEELQ